MPPLLILASASPARLTTLRNAGMAPQVRISGVDEDEVAASLDNPTPPELCLALATAKAEAVASTVDSGLVVGCDSMLELAGKAYGKPKTAEVARARWAQMAGNAGLLHTGHCVIDVATGKSSADTATTAVRFGTPTEQELEAYVSSGEPLAVAGAFTIDGLGAIFIEGIDGDPHNVVGISLPLLRRLLHDLGVPITDLWQLPD
ncbi:Maf family protein [Fodinicola feengrottensis]|uniref:Nucleoside triphosphate pyrophosphatase n=1 Tax=Fodinicola feengrottensis TaxID=435914 RepID=A0ABN2GDE3_9ACTN